MKTAACRHVDTDVFFVERGASTRRAKAICGNCPVRAACLEYAIEYRLPFGIYGGLTPRARRQWARQAREGRRLPA